MKKLLALAAALVLALSACETPTGAVDPDPDTGTSATLTVVNQTSGAIAYMYISPCSDSGWGSDRLGSDDVINSGASRSWTVAAGCYDLRAENGVGGSAQTLGVQIAAGARFTWNVVP